MKIFCTQFLVLCKQGLRINFGVKAAQIDDRKLIRIALIRINLLSLWSSISASFHARNCLKNLAYIALVCCTAASLCAEPYPVKDYSVLLNMPGFNSTLLEMHFKLYAGYVKNTNDLMTALETMNSGSYEYGALKRRLGWEFDGMRLHELYFENLGGNGQPNTSSPLYTALVAQFGSYENWKKDFIATGMMRGIGWAILYFDPQMKKLVNVWINEHDVGHLATGAPILIMDVFEHAYMPQFGLDRAKYIDVLFTNINWNVATQRYSAVMTQKASIR